MVPSVTWWMQAPIILISYDNAALRIVDPYWKAAHKKVGLFWVLIYDLFSKSTLQHLVNQISRIVV